MSLLPGPRALVRSSEITVRFPLQCNHVVPIARVACTPSQSCWEGPVGESAEGPEATTITCTLSMGTRKYGTSFQ